MSTVASKLGITKVGRVCVTVADTDRAIDFYAGKLGFEKVVDVPMGAGHALGRGRRRGAETTIALAPPPPGQGRGAPRPGSSSTRPTSTARTPRCRGPAPTSTPRSPATAGPCRRCSGSATLTATR